MKQKAYGAVLALAAMGFVVDRIFFTPADSEAASPPAAHAAAAPADPASTSAGAASSTDAQPAPAGWLAERLRAAAPPTSDNDLRDVFALPASWRPAAKPVAAAGTARPQLLGEQFRREHHLIAVLIEGRNGRAVVDGQLVPVGGAIDGFRLVSVTQRSAQFTHGDEQASLTLADSDAANAR